MKRIIFLFVLAKFFIINTCYAQIRTLFHNEILYGKVQRLTESQVISSFSRGTTTLPVEDTTYFDGNGNTIERHVRVNNLHIYKYITKFNSDGHKLETTCDTGIKKQVLKYDKRGNMTEMFQVSKAGKPYRSNRLKYDAQHNLTEYDGYDDTGKVFMKKSYLYNDKGFIIKERDYDSKSPTFIYLYTYSNYDDKGNWTSLKITSHFRDSKPGDDRITSRQITYYQKTSTY